METPLEFLRSILATSSAQPSSAYAAVAADVATTAGAKSVSRHATVTATGKKLSPPMVGVPFFFACDVGPSVRTTCTASGRYRVSLHL